MAAGDFYFTNPEAARQAIAQIQLQAALAENKSRENIAREATAAQRYATQAQIAERDKDRAVYREDIASRSRNRSDYALDAASRERADVQYSTVLGAINAVDPLTVGELEALFAAHPQLTEDYRKNLRAERDRAYKVAKGNAAAGERMAKNFRSELGVKGLLDLDRQKIYERMAKDANVIFDRVSGSVESAFRPPREDASPTQSSILGAARPGGVFPSAQEMQAAGRPGTVPTIERFDDIRNRVTGVPAGTYEPTLPPTQSTITAQPSPGFIPRSTDFAVPRTTTADFAIPPFIDMSSPARQPSMPSYGPPNNAMIFNSLPTVQRSPFQPDINGLLRFIQHPNFSLLAPAEQQAVMDEIDIVQRMPRVSDLQTLRPEYRPQMEDRYIPLQ